MSADAAMLLLFTACVLVLLAVLAAVGDWWDGRERRDARRRNR